MKRTIDFVVRNKNADRKETITISLYAKNNHLRKSYQKTDLGYVDVTVHLDRLGRLKGVLLEKSRPL